MRRQLSKTVGINPPMYVPSNAGVTGTIKSIDLIVQNLPPVHDAIGEYTALLSRELAAQANVRILTDTSSIPDEIEHVKIEHGFTLCSSNRFNELRNQLYMTKANVALLQYNPFSWGRRGWAPDLVETIKQFKSRRPDVCMGIMFHETFMMNRGFRSWVMRQYQKSQFRSLVSTADICFFSTELWAQQLIRRNPNATAVHLPVGANTPLSTAAAADTRRRWHIQEDDFVCGVFGGAHPSRMLPWIEYAVSQIRAEHKARRVVLLHVGGERIDWLVPGVPVIRTGRLPAQCAADAISIMDLQINPFADGLSTRRGSAMAALQQGVPVLSTSGHATDSLWNTYDGHFVYLSSTTSLENWKKATYTAVRSIDQRGTDWRNAIRSFYMHNFSWPVIAQKLCFHFQVSCAESWQC